MSSYIDENLIPGETILVKGDTHWIIYLRPVIWLSIPMVILPFAPVVALPLIGLCILWVIGIHVSSRSHELVVTSRRVVFKSGLFNRNIMEMDNRKVESFQVEQSVVGRMLNYGTVTIKGSGGTSTPVVSVAAPMEFRKAAMMAVDGR